VLSISLRPPLPSEPSSSLEEIQFITLYHLIMFTSNMLMAVALALIYSFALAAPLPLKRADLGAPFVDVNGMSTCKFRSPECSGAKLNLSQLPQPSTPPS
jgi:hypothetical protein